MLEAALLSLLFLPHLPLHLAETCPASMGSDVERNVLGGALEICSTEPLTGWYRDGYCRTDSQGNDLSTARLPGFPVLRPGDRWCLCAARWKEALQAGAAPTVVLEASHRAALNVASLEEMSGNRQ